MLRREFLKAFGIALLSFLTRSSGHALSPKQYGGLNLDGWDIAVGDGVYAAPGEPAVSITDIETIHFAGANSELRANTQRRRIMAHNITFRRIIDSHAFDYVHTCGFKWRVPYLPATNNFDLNAQTVEGGLFIWDGGKTRLDYGVGFQWMLNPWLDTFGEIGVWTGNNGGQWEKAGYLAPDTQWHEIQFSFDFYQGAVSMKIDGMSYPAYLAATPKPETWGPETAARLQAEIISIYPEPGGIRALHKAEFKEWFWVWEPAKPYQVFLPITRN